MNKFEKEAIEIIEDALEFDDQYHFISMGEGRIYIRGFLDWDDLETEIQFNNYTEGCLILSLHNGSWMDNWSGFIYMNKKIEKVLNYLKDYLIDLYSEFASLYDKAYARMEGLDLDYEKVKTLEKIAWEKIKNRRSILAK